MSTAISLFKLSVESFQQHTIEVSFEMTWLPYRWTSMANHFSSILIWNQYL